MEWYRKQPYIEQNDSISTILIRLRFAQYVEKRRLQAQEAREFRRSGGSTRGGSDNNENNVVYVEHYPVYDSARRDLFRDDNDSAAVRAGDRLRGSRGGASGGGRTTQRPSSAGVYGTGRAGTTRRKKAHTYTHMGAGGGAEEEGPGLFLNTVGGIMRGSRPVQHRYRDGRGGGGGGGNGDGERRVWRDGDNRKMFMGGREGDGGDGGDGGGDEAVWRDFREPGSLLIF